jgi:hypothetical protein
MPKNNFFAAFLFFTLLVLTAPEASYARGIREMPSWESIAISDNFTWYNVLYNQKGEEIGLEETNKPMYGQNVVLIYRAEGLENGRPVRISVYDGDMEYVFSKNSIIKNGEIKANIMLLSNTQKLANMETEDDLEYFCILDLPNSKRVKSKKININLTLSLDIEAYEHELNSNPERWDFEFHLESTDGEYKQARNVLKDGMVYGEHRIQRLVYTGILLNKNYNIIQRLPDGYELHTLVYNLNVLDFLEYYDE